jgi:hypothetical protein
MRPSSTSNTSAASTSPQAKKMCRTSCRCRNVMIENSAPVPQMALPSVNQSAR